MQKRLKEYEKDCLDSIAYAHTFPILFVYPLSTDIQKIKKIQKIWENNEQIIHSSFHFFSYFPFALMQVCIFPISFFIFFRILFIWRLYVEG